MSDAAARIPLGSGVDMTAPDNPRIEVDRLGLISGANVPGFELLGPITGRPFADLLSPGDREYFASPSDDPSERFAGLFLHRPDSEDAVPRFTVTSAERRDGDAGWLLSGREPTPDDLRAARVVDAARFVIVGRLASGVAHELNNILSTVTTFSDLLLPRVGGDPSVTEDLREIRNAAIDASHVLRKLDMFAGGRAKGPAPTHVQDVLAGMDKLLRRFVPRGVEVGVHVAADCPPVHTDPLRLEEALFALVAEARDALPGGGRMTISADSAPGGDASLNRHVQLGVAWTGTPGEDAHPPSPLATDRSVAQGAGLGRSLAHRFAAAAGGRFRCEDDPSGGTKAWIELPVHAESSAFTGG